MNFLLKKIILILLVFLVVSCLIDFCRGEENIHYKQMNMENKIHSWEHLVGMEGNQAKEAILKDNPSLTVHVVPHVGINSVFISFILTKV
jgi:hypothetical protein